LIWETSEENNARKIAHGTHLYGERVPTAKLDDPMVALIRADLARGEAIAWIAKMCRVNERTIRDIAEGKTWRA
jgi:hypothetical protein